MPDTSKQPGIGRRPRPGHPWLRSLFFFVLVVCTGLMVWAAVERVLAPASNTSQEHFDAIVVLGYPADSDGNPSPAMLARVTEAVHEYERGTAPRLIVTGGAAHTNVIEADLMAEVAIAQGVPPTAILKDRDALDTIQNACYAGRIMKNNGWTSLEVVSSPEHLPRAAMIFSQLPVSWRMHPAPDLRPNGEMVQTATSVVEIVKTARYLVWAKWLEQCQP